MLPPPCVTPSLRLATDGLTLILVLRGNLVERRVRHLVAIYFRRALDHRLQRAQHGGIRIAAIRLGILLLLPQADREHFVAFGREKRDLVLEPGLLAQHRERSEEHTSELQS